MKRFKIVLLLVAVMCLFNSCLAGESRKLFSDNAEAADRQMEQVAAAIKARDKEALKAIFSKKALNEAEDFDERLDYLFLLIQGEVISWESADSSRYTSESIKSGHRVKQVSSFYYMTTDKQKYFFILDDIPVDTYSADNVGLYTLVVVKKEDEKKVWEGDQNIDCAGIFKLEK